MLRFVLTVGFHLGGILKLFAEWAEATELRQRGKCVFAPAVGPHSPYKAEL